MLTRPGIHKRPLFPFPYRIILQLSLPRLQYRENLPKLLLHSHLSLRGFRSRPIDIRYLRIGFRLGGFAGRTRWPPAACAADGGEAFVVHDVDVGKALCHLYDERNGEIFEVKSHYVVRGRRS
jgi:hypothetical protein